MFFFCTYAIAQLSNNNNIKLKQLHSHKITIKVTNYNIFNHISAKILQTHISLKVLGNA